MTKPQSFHEQRVVASETKYQVSDASQKGPQAGSGTLAAGRVVWVQGSADGRAQQPSVDAYAEGIGVVSLDVNCLHA